MRKLAHKTPNTKISYALAEGLSETAGPGRPVGSGPVFATSNRGRPGRRMSRSTCFR
ncbi:hypothetical protein SBA4_2990008 [Candidatus Sulfopaludibacter sp. SbA4]|nr:hypothetical protein SBA4_2990008 [Candidatus Sulfopaludibacter sp. SbA4]